jgi:hypothetical protein
MNDATACLRENGQVQTLQLAEGIVGKRLSPMSLGRLTERLESAGDAVEPLPQHEGLGWKHRIPKSAPLRLYPLDASPRSGLRQP